MLTTAPEPGAKPQSGLSVMRSGARNCSALRTRPAIVSRGIDLAGRDIDAAEADLEVLAQFAEHGHVAGLRRGELHREVMHLEPVEVAEDRAVAAAVRMLRRARAPPARRQRCTASLTPVMPLTTSLIMSTAKAAAASGSAYWLRTVGIDEQAQVRIVDLHDVRAGIAHEFQFAAQNRHAGAHEVVALRIGLRGFLRVPHPLAEQRGRGQRGLDRAGW